MRSKVAIILRYHAAPVVAMLVPAACAVDTDEDEVLGDLTAPGWGEMEYGCWATGEWSEIAYEGAGFVSASMDGEVKGHPVGRIQRIQLRESHDLSMDSYTSTVTGDPAATEWQWHAHCEDGSDTHGRWLTTPSEVYYGTGCITTSLSVRVRAANCLDPEASL